MTDEESIFAEAVTKASPAARAAYLEEACAGDNTLRRGVEALLLAHDRPRGVLESPPVDCVATAEMTCPSHPVGSTVGPYKLLERIGEGGMGIVYMAEQLRPIWRKVAVKIIKPGMDSGQVVARFEAERQALAMMDHPNIAKVLDAGTTDAGRPYFVMELVKGIPITDYCDEARLTTRQRLELFVPVCNAVQHAHQKGLIHRDLKPTNVLVTLLDDRPVPKVIDFGIAKATGAAGQVLTERTLFTNYAQMLGTPLYMSPEQAQLSGTDVDTRSDVYSLGVLLYELLTGTTPFDKQRLREAAYDEVRRIIREEDPPNPSTRLSTMGDQLSSVSAQRHTEPRKLGQLVRGELDWIVMKALEKDRIRRYETANGLARDVERHLNDESVQACPPSPLYKLRKFARRNRVGTTASAVVAAALMAGAAAATFGLVRARAGEARARQEASKADAANVFMREMLASVDPNRVKGRGVLVRDVLDEATRRLERGALREQPAAEAPVRASLGSTYWKLGHYREAEPHLRAAVELYRQASGAEHRDVVVALVDLGSFLWSSRSPLTDDDEADRIARAAGGEAERLCREALAMSRKVVGDEHLLTATVQGRLAKVLQTEGQVDESERLLRLALATRRRLQAAPDLETVTVYTDLAIRLDEKGDSAAAEPLYREALVMGQGLVGEEHTEVARVLNALAGCLRLKGDLAGARSLHRRAVATNRKLLGQDHPHFSKSLFNYAETLHAGGDYDGALARMREAWSAELSRTSSAIGASPSDAGARAYRGECYARLGRFGEASADLTKAIKLDPGEHRWWYTSACLHLYLRDEEAYRNVCRAMVNRFGQTAVRDVGERTATACLLAPGTLGGPERSAGLLDQAVASGPQNGPAPRLTLSQGIAEYRAGDFRSAVNTLTEARDGLRDLVKADTTVAAAELFLAMAYHGLGRGAEAHAAFDRGVQLTDAPAVRVELLSVRYSPEDWLICHIARREAEATLGKKGAIWQKGPVPATRPLLGRPVTLPGMVQADDYDLGGNGEAYRKAPVTAAPKPPG